jgi:histone deacetylase complex regulatory component SIN3
VLRADGIILVADWMQDSTNTKTTIRLFPSDESTFDSDVLSDEAKWQYYIASYTMSDPTEGVDSSELRWPFLRRRLSQPKGSVDNAYSAVYGSLQNEEAQIVSISPESYKMYYEGGFNFHRVVSGPEKKQENDQFVDKFVKRPTWVGEESGDAFNRRMAGWKKALEEDLSGYEAGLARPAAEFAAVGDITMSEGDSMKVGHS